MNKDLFLLLKPTTMKKLILALSVVFLSYIGLSQNQYTTTIVTCNNENQTNPTDWVSYIDNEVFKIDYKFIDCDPDMGFDFETVILKIQNKTSTIIDIDWFIDMYYNDVCRTCDHPIEYSRTIQLAPNEIIEGTCDRNTNQQLKLFSKFIDAAYTNGSRLTGFQLNTLTTTTVD